MVTVDRREVGLESWWGKVSRGCALFLVLAMTISAQPLQAQQSSDGDRMERLERLSTLADRLRLHASGDRVRLGVMMDVEADEELTDQGVVLGDVAVDGPAWEAGMRPGDLLIEIDGHELSRALPDRRDEAALDGDTPRTSQRLVALLAKLKAGDRVEAVWLRDGDRMEGEVELLGRITFSRDDDGWRAIDPDEFEIHESFPQLFRFRPGPRGEGDFEVRLRDHSNRFRLRCVGGSGWAQAGACDYGIRVSALNADLAEYFGTETGALVLEVTAASSLGLRPGDVVQEIGGRSVEDPGEFHRILESYEAGEEVDFTVRRQGERISVSGVVE